MLKIVQYPHPTLRYKAKPIRRVDGEVYTMVRQMFDLMYAARGVGLASTQVDLPFRLFIVNLAAHPDEGEEMVFLNPVLEPAGKSKAVEEGEEGCLSLPELYGPVTRPLQVRVKAYSIQGEEVDALVDGMLARVVQHEADHLDGVLFFDRMTETARLEIQPELLAMEAEFQRMREEGQIPDDDQIKTQLQEWEQKYC